MRFQLAAFADEADSRLDGQIAAMRGNGIAYLEIRGVDGQNIADISLEKAAAIRKRLEEAGLAVWSLGSPYGKIGIRDAFAPHLESFRRGLELAAVLGCSHIRLFSFYIPEGEPAASYRDAVMERLEQFRTAAQGSGVILCHENEKGIYGDTAARCADIHRTFPDIRAVFDPANFIQCGQEIPAAWEELAPYVEYMHIKDALADGTVVPAGKGIGRLPWLLQRYAGRVLTLEPHLAVFSGLDKLEQAEHQTEMTACRYASSEEAFRAAADALKALL